MKALVVGGSSFIGEELIKELLKSKQDFIVTYNKSIINDKDKNIKIIKIDITDKSSLDKLYKYDFDTVFHLASLPGDTGNPEQMVNVNITGLQNMLELALKKNVKKFILTSSISAVGWYPPTKKFEKPLYLPVDEIHPCRPVDMYTATKRMQEILAIAYYHQYKLPVSVLRLTLVVGPAGRGGGEFWKEFALSLKEGKEIQLPVYSEKEVLHFVDIRDVANMHIKAAESEKADGEIFNCCARDPFSGEDFKKIIKKMYPEMKISLGFPWSLSQGNALYFDMSKAKKLLDFEPEYNLKDSIYNIAQWVEKSF
ncbi:MAG: NAD(P)-dependent oxidoreductase [Actinobacteria bacterium]|nr:NAD(P)-dependent oxidoreductase [Actinomycetota bacterium]